MQAKHTTIIEKTGVRAGFEIGYAVGMAELVYEKHTRRRLVVTSLLDGVHSPGSLHYKGRGADLRTRDLTAAEREAITADLKTRLEAQGFDIVLEGDHIHMEFDPKPGEAFITRVP